ncbi:MAG: dienelactone hydrolase family protein [Betaproteobacteria bacterium]
MKPNPTARARLSVILGLLAIPGLLPGVFAQDLVIDFKSGQPTGKYSFASSTPKTFPDFVRAVPADPVNIVGHLFLPPAGDKVPAIVLMHGSGGIYNAMLDFWPKQFNAAGYAMFAVDSFGPRGVQSTAEDQGQVPFSADVADAFAALKLLASHPRIDASRIAIMGFSRGGHTTWRTAVERIIAAQKLPDGLRFAAHVPVYSAGCTGSLRLVVKPGVFGKAPMLWIHGDVDDYTAIAPCKDYVERIGAAGTPVDFVVIEGAHHKFDGDDLRRVYVRGAVRSKAECPVAVDIDTFQAFDFTTGARLQGPAFQEAMKACVTTGATVEGNPKARDKAAQAALAFFKKTFGR